MSLPIWWNEIKRKYFIKQIKLNFDNMKYIVFNFFSIILIFTSCEKEELEQINILIELAKKGDNSIIDMSDTIGLPRIVRKYFEFSGVEGAERIRFMKFKSEGKLKLSTAGNWLIGYSEEYLTIPNPSRNWIAEIKQSSLITAYTYETYIEGKGKNTVEFFSPSIFQISYGEEFDTSGLITYLDDLILSPTSLFSDNIIWNHLTDSTAQVSFSDCGITVSATCFFDKSGCIKKLISFDRYRAIDNDVVKTKWTTLFYNYKQLNGYNIPTSIEYIWNLENKDFVYATIDIIDVNYDEFNTY